MTVQKQDIINLKRIQTGIATRAVQACSMYADKWGNEFAVEHVGEAVKTLSRDFQIELSNMTPEQCDELNFGHWDKDQKLRLYPGWVFPFIKKGTLICDINGKESEFDPETDDPDSRFGYLAYGPQMIDDESVSWDEPEFDPFEDVDMPSAFQSVLANTNLKTRSDHGNDGP